MAAPTKSYLFDGVDEFVDFGNIPKLIEFGTGDLTYACWAKSSQTTTSAQRFLSYAATAGNDFRISLGISGSTGDSKAFFSIRDSGGPTQENAIGNAILLNTDFWFLLIGVRESNTMKLYFNKVLQTVTGTNNVNLANPSNPNFSIGRFPDGTGFHGGNILLPVIYDFALNQAQVNEFVDFGLSLRPPNLSFADPIFHPPFDELTVFDHAYEVILGDAADLDGVDEHITLPVDDDFVVYGTGDFFIEFDVISLGTSTSFQYMYTAGDIGGTTNRIGCSFIPSDIGDPNKLNVFIEGSSINSNSAIAGDGIKHKVRLYRESAVVKLDIDGVTQTETSANTTNFATAAGDTVRIGSHWSSDRTLNGRIGNLNVNNTHSYALGRSDTLPTAIDGTGSLNGTYVNMEAVDLGTFFGGKMTNMQAGSIVEDVPDEPSGVVEKGIIQPVVDPIINPVISKIF